ncbi:MAG: hypothetical protein DDT42_01901 [candidate division WS2 bacterium]|uniref:Uncharacterized protein n=1 Tax=Psychracetigena formicireducens TaxID=2986056 RepID=A0A9E2F2Q5_PSYF1|nr:hypothetical protein [Candidatus Psychracetigena formicireducens]
MTKKKPDGSQDLTSKYQVSPQVWEVVLKINNRLKYIKKKTGTNKWIGEIGPEEMIWIDVFLKTGNIRQASYTAFEERVKSKYHARNIGKAKLEKPMIQTAITQLLQEGSYEDSKLLNKLSEVIYEDSNPANILKGLDMAFKLKGSYAPDKKITANIPGIAGSVTPDELQDTITQYLEEGDEQHEEDILDRIALKDGQDSGGIEL